MLPVVVSSTVTATTAIATAAAVNDDKSPCLRYYANSPSQLAQSILSIHLQRPYLSASKSSWNLALVDYNVQ